MRIPRRTFIQRLAAGAHGLASAGVAIGAPAIPGKIRTGILGVQHSHLAGKLQAMRRHGDYELVSAADPDPATRAARAAGKDLEGLRWVSPDEMLADKSLHLIVFEGEVKDAIPLGRRVLEAGKHLHLEKPPTNKLEPFRDLTDLARKRNLLLQLGYLWRYHAGAEAALEAHKKGWLGDVIMIRATINSDRSADQRAVEARYPGGSMFELGGHMIDLVVAHLGRPTAVRHWLRHDTKIADKLADNTLAVFEYPSALATIVSSAKVTAIDQHRSFEVIGTDGSVMILPMEPAPVLRVHLREARGPYKKGSQEIRLPAQPRFVRDFEELAKALKSGVALKYSYDHELLLHESLLRASGEIA